MPTHALEFAPLQDSQKRGLQLRRKLPDFVEEQRSA
jgi:hypothetical protein